MTTSGNPPYQRSHQPNQPNQPNQPANPQFQPYQPYPVPANSSATQVGYDPSAATTQIVRQSGALGAGLPQPTLPPPPQPPRRGVSRRTVVIGAAAGAVAVGAVGAGLGFALPNLLHHQSGPALNLSSSNVWQINHLLRRMGFGPAPADIGEYLSAGVAGSVDKLLNYSSVSNAALDTRLNAMNLSYATVADLFTWAVTRMLYTARPLEEKMTMFWHGVLTSSFRKVGGQQGFPFLIQQDQLLRANAMGRFDDLITAISTDPAMLFWLDGVHSTGSAPNENYSRELMELFTMGINTYTQNDVHNGALALTGWKIYQGKGVFVPRLHYNGSITYLGDTGQLGLSDVVRLVCSHPTTATHIAARMWSFFVWDNPTVDDIKPLVDAYNNSNHNIGAMVKAMLNSSAFFSQKAYRARVKSPAEFTINVARAFGIPIGHAAAPYLALQMNDMGQTLFDPPNVAGWIGDAYSSNWVSTQAWLTKVNLANTLVGAITGAPINAKGHGGKPITVTQAMVSASLAQQTITAQALHTAQDTLTYFATMLLDNQLTSDRRSQLLTVLTSGSTSSEPTFALTGGAKIAASGLRETLYLLLSVPEYHMN